MQVMVCLIVLFLPGCVNQDTQKPSNTDLARVVLCSTVKDDVAVRVSKRVEDPPTFPKKWDFIQSVNLKKRSDKILELVPGNYLFELTSHQYDYAISSEQLQLKSQELVTVGVRSYSRSVKKDQETKVRHVGFDIANVPDHIVKDVVRRVESHDEFDQLVSAQILPDQKLLLLSGLSIDLNTAENLIGPTLAARADDGFVLDGIALDWFVDRRDQAIVALTRVRSAAPEKLILQKFSLGQNGRPDWISHQQVLVDYIGREPYDISAHYSFVPNRLFRNGNQYYLCSKGLGDPDYKEENNQWIRKSPFVLFEFDTTTLIQAETIKLDVSTEVEFFQDIAFVDNIEGCFFALFGESIFKIGLTQDAKPDVVKLNKQKFVQAFDISDDGKTLITYARGYPEHSVAIYDLQVDPFAINERQRIESKRDDYHNFGPKNFNFGEMELNGDFLDLKAAGAYELNNQLNPKFVEVTGKPQLLRHQNVAVHPLGKIAAKLEGNIVSLIDAESEKEFLTREMSSTAEHIRWLNDTHLVVTDAQRFWLFDFGQNIPKMD